MPFNVILKQHPDNSNPNHFQYQCLVAFNTSLDANMIKTSIDIIMDSLTRRQTKTAVEASYFVFKLENLTDCFDESVIGRVVTTAQLVDILNSDEFIENVADCSLLLGAITVNHYLILQERVVYDTCMDDDEIQWSPEAFAEYYKNSLWRIYN